MSGKPFLYAARLLQKEEEPAAWLEKMESLICLKEAGGEDFSDNERRLCDIFSLAAEMENGGFIRFVKNIDAAAVPENGLIVERTIDALRSAGLSRHAAIVQKAYALFICLSDAEREALSCEDEDFNAIDSEYYELTENDAYERQALIEPLRFFVHSNSDSFRLRHMSRENALAIIEGE